MSWKFLSRITKQTSKKVLNLSLSVIIGVSGLAAAAPFLFSQSAYATSADVYVSTAGSDTLNDCSLIASPCKTIGYALTQVASGGNVHVITAGIYTENLVITQPVNLIGPNANVDPNTVDSRSAEAIINGGSGTTIIPAADGITINGFTISSTDSGFPIYTETNTTSNLNISYDIVGSGVRAITVDGNGDNVTISHDQLNGSGYGLLIDGNHNNLKVNNNVINGPDTDYAMFMNVSDGVNGYNVNGFELKDNHIYDTVNIGANVSNADVSGNTFDAQPTSGLDAQMALHNSTVTGNTFVGGSANACFQLFGSQYGIVPSDTVTISGNNTFNDCGANTSPWNFGFQLSQGVNNITFSGNTLTNAYDAISTRTASGWTLNSNIHINSNSITGTRDLGVNNTVTGTLDATLNYWGGGVPAVSGGVNTTPYFTNAAMTTRSDAMVLPDSGGNATANNTTPQVVVTNPTQPVTVTVTNGTTDATIDFSALQSGNQATLPQTTINTQNANVQIQAGTTVTASGSWNGIINLPTIQTNTSISIPTPSGTSTTLGTVIDVGSDSVNLTFDKPVRLLIAGQANKLVGFIRNGAFTQITTACTADNATTQLSVNGDCFINVGSDMVIWTKHFTQFVTYTRNNTYVIQPGDTLSGIAAKLGLTLAQLEALNPNAGHPAGNFNLILPGDVLNVGSAVVTASVSPSAAATNGSATPVLGATTGTGGGYIGSAASTTKAPAAAVAKAVKNGGKFLGIAWYLWLVGLVVLAGAGYFAYLRSSAAQRKS